LKINCKRNKIFRVAEVLDSIFGVSENCYSMVGDEKCISEMDPCIESW